MDGNAHPCPADKAENIALSSRFTTPLKWLNERQAIAPLIHNAGSALEEEKLHLT